MSPCPLPQDDYYSFFLNHLLLSLRTSTSSKEKEKEGVLTGSCCGVVVGNESCWNQRNLGELQVVEGLGGKADRGNGVARDRCEDKGLESLLCSASCCSQEDDNKYNFTTSLPSPPRGSSAGGDLVPDFIPAFASTIDRTAVEGHNGDAEKYGRMGFMYAFISGGTSSGVKEEDELDSYPPMAPPSNPVNLCRPPQPPPESLSAPFLSRPETATPSDKTLGVKLFRPSRTEGKGRPCSRGDWRRKIKEGGLQPEHFTVINPQDGED